MSRNESIMTTNSSSNGTSGSMASLDLTQLYVDIGVSSFGMITSVLSFMAILADKNLRGNFHLMLSLVVGDFFNCMAYLVSNSVRIDQVFSGTNNMRILPIECLKIPYVALYLVGNQLPALSTLAICIERAAAIFIPFWYHNRWNSTNAARAATALYLFSLVSLIGGIIVVVTRPQILVPISCNTQTITGNVYGGYNYALSIICSCGALVLSVAMMVAVHLKLRSLQSEIKGAPLSREMAEANHKKLERQKDLITGVALISFISFILTLPSNLRLFGAATSLFSISISIPFLSQLVTIGYCANSSLTIFALCTTNSDFRRSLTVIIWPWRKRTKIALIVTKNKVVATFMVGTVDTR